MYMCCAQNVLFPFTPWNIIWNGDKDPFSSHPGCFDVRLRSCGTQRWQGHPVWNWRACLRHWRMSLLSQLLRLENIQTAEAKIVSTFHFTECRKFHFFFCNKFLKSLQNSDPCICLQRTCVLNVLLRKVKKENLTYFLGLYFICFKR